MSWQWTGDKPLSEPMIVQYTDAYTGHLAQGVTQLNYMNMGSKGNKFLNTFA